MLIAELGHVLNLNQSLGLAKPRHLDRRVDREGCQLHPKIWSENGGRLVSQRKIKLLLQRLQTHGGTPPPCWWFSKYSPYTITTISVTWEPVEMWTLRPHPRPTGSETQGVGPSNLCSNSSSRLILMHTQFWVPPHYTSDSQLCCILQTPGKL